ncbi:MAG: class I mannose-6-phosphate isomerase [Bacteroidales bacterium]|nr:class I mannose-6-phosphate isomerase [Bacteroidales bacterium]
MENLYPLKFSPILKEKIWGGDKLNRLLNKDTASKTKIGESWEISGVEGDISIVSNGFLKGNNLNELIEIYMGDLIGDSIYEKFGEEFPVLIKFIDAADDLSIQVHPDDLYAQKRHKSYGKTEMWYIVQADKDAELITGFAKECSKPEYLAALNSGNLLDLLNEEKVSVGDVFFIPPGRVHAIGKGILLTEIQQTSDITYRIFDWGRTDSNGNHRELHTDLALDVIDFKAYPSYKTEYSFIENKTSNILKCPYFTTNILSFNQIIEKDYNLIDSFVIYICIEGNFKIGYEKNEFVNINFGESVLLPAILKNVRLIPDNYCKILEIYID